MDRPPIFITGIQNISIMNYKELSDKYAESLREDILPFWINNSLDQQYGGYFTCLLRDGQVFDTDKFVWLQARQVWMFAKLYQQVEKKDKWLEIAKSGAEFLKNYGHDAMGNWYFSITREGRPLTQPYSVFSDCFCCLAFGQLFKVTQDEQYRKIALTTFENILGRKDNPKGQYNKRTSNRELKSFAFPMILVNLITELDDLLETEDRSRFIQNFVDEILNDFAQDGLLFENVLTNGQLSDSMDGRLINPGHGLEAMWFLLDVEEVKRHSDQIETIHKLILSLLKFGWDDQYGGIYYFLDAKGFPLQQLEFDQKLWWVHLEAMIACLKGYQSSNDLEFLEWFERLHTYSWAHFSDPEYGEWFGYLHRDGSRLNELKGGKWKGCFHVPRAFMQLSGLLAEINQSS